MDFFGDQWPVLTPRCPSREGDGGDPHGKDPRDKHADGDNDPLPEDGDSNNNPLPKDGDRDNNPPPEDRAGDNNPPPGDDPPPDRDRDGGMATTPPNPRIGGT